MKKIICILSVSFLLFNSCESFLDTENLTQKDSSNFPVTPEDADLLLTGTYVQLTNTWPLNILYYLGELMSDNCLGGGGPNDTDCKDINSFHASNLNKFRNAWQQNYRGIFRANSIIVNADRIEWKTGEAGLAEKNRILGESRFLRAYFYFDLARLFENVPLRLKIEVENPPQATPDETYAQIAADLKTAIETLSAEPLAFPSSGRVTKWAAEGYMAKVFLFYTGYYQKETLPLPDGSSITKEQVIDWLEDCIRNSGHDLVDDFRTLWPYSYRTDKEEFKRNTIYNYLKVNNIAPWEGDGNKESVFSVKYTALNTGWTGSGSKSNMVCLYYGFRIDTEAGDVNYYQATFPFGQGWGQGTVNSRLWEQWPDNDLRKKGSIMNVFDPEEDMWLDPDDPPFFRLGADGQTEETGYWNKKHLPVNAGNRLTVFSNFNRQFYPKLVQDIQEENIQDLVIMRFADILLMAAELGAPNAKTYLNRVHQRGVPGEEIEVTLENIMNERRFELAFEGSRYYDLLRWHKTDWITENQTDVEVYNQGVWGGKVNVVYRPETRGFLPIPDAEIQLSGGVLKPNPGW
jgi:hypothetical protein